MVDKLVFCAERALNEYTARCRRMCYRVYL